MTSKQRKYLGELEELVLLSALSLGDSAHGADIRQDLMDRIGRVVSISTIYVVLIRMEEKRFVTSRLSEPTPERGGKAKRLFQVEEPGREALRESWSARNTMWEGTEEALGIGKP